MPWDPMKGERLAPAWAAALKLLDDGRWHPWGDVLAVMLDASDLKPGTCSNLIYAGIREGVLDRHGRYSQRTRRDTRVIAKAGQR